VSCARPDLWEPRVSNHPWLPGISVSAKLKHQCNHLAPASSTFHSTVAGGEALTVPTEKTPLP